MDLRSVFRTVICLLLCFCLVLNVGRVEADAVVLVDDAAISLGLVALLILGACGVVYNLQSDSDIAALGNDLNTYLYQWGTEAEVLEEVESWLDTARVVSGGSDNDGDGDIDPDDKVIGITAAVSAGLVSWMARFAYKNGFIESPIVDANGDPVVEFGGLVSSGTPFEYKPGYSCTCQTDVMLFKCFRYSGGDLLSFYFVSPSSSQFKYSVTGYSSTYTASKYVTVNGSNYRYAFQNVALDNYTSSELIYYSAGAVNIDDLGLSVDDFLKQAIAGSIEGGSVTNELYPSTYVGDIPSGLADGSISESDLTISDITYGNIEVSEGEDEKDAILGLMGGLNDGSLSYDDYLDLVIPEVDSGSSSDPTTGTDSEIEGETGSDVNQSFLYKLMDYLLAGMQKMWDTLGTLFTTYIVNPIKEFWSKSIALIEAGVFWETLASTITAPLEALGNMILEGIRSIFVPQEDFLTEKVEAIRAEFAFADAIISTAEFIGSSLTGISTEPPVIYINLASNRGPYDLGGEVVFLDLRWYEEYKPIGDAILSAFLYLCFAWRLFVKLPAIIGGLPGDFVMQTFESAGLDSRLPSRNMGYEVKRMVLRESVSAHRGLKVKKGGK